MAQADQRTNGNATLSIFEAARLASSSEVYCCGYEGGHSAFWPHLAWFCPECGEIWRREVYDYHFTYRPIPPAKWIVREDLCPGCAPQIFQRLLRNYP